MRVPSSTLRLDRVRPWLRRAVAAVALLSAPYVVALALLSNPAVQARLRERIVRTLRAELGSAVVVEGDVGVDPSLRISFGPLLVDDPTPGALPFVRVERVRARPRIGGLLAGRVEPASVELAGARVVLGPGARTAGARIEGKRSASALARRERRTEPRDRLAVRFRSLVVEVPARGHAVELGPFDGELTREREDGGERIALDLDLPGGGRAGIEARRAPGGEWHGWAWGSRLGPELVPRALGGGAAGLAGGSMSVAAEGTAAPDLATAEVRLRVRGDGIALAGERVGPAPVGPIRAEAEGALRWIARDRRLSLAGARVSLFGAIPLRADGEVRLVPGHPFLLALRADEIELAAALDALPPALAPPSGVPRPAGTLEARAEIAGPLLAPSAWTLSAALDLSRMRAAARAAPPVALRAPFVHRAASGATIEVGPANPDFVAIADLPAHVVRAITTGEDAGFFAHEGFDFGELRNALAEDAVAGRVVRGGSTITQQLAKNLFLTGERTLARKVREAVITVALEATVPKQRLLEIYLNIVEWGPGVRGLGPAARHWFGKDARELTPKEAAFLASIIPNPTRYHSMHDRGEISEAWRRRVEDLLLKMKEQGVLGSDDLTRALAEPIVFTHG